MMSICNCYKIFVRVQTRVLCVYILTGFAGTPGYLSPEVLRKDPYGKPVDIWACGQSVNPIMFLWINVTLKYTYMFCKFYIQDVYIECVCVCQVWSSTSCWWDTLPSGTKTNTNCTNKLRPVHMMWVPLSDVYVNRMSIICLWIDKNHNREQLCNTEGCWLW